LTALSIGLGLNEIAFDSSTGDGTISMKDDPPDPSTVVYAKYGVHLDGRAFVRARIGGVTKAVSPPLTAFRSEGFLVGVSVGIETSGKKTIIDRGVFQDEVALHFIIGQASRGKSLKWTQGTSPNGF
jgi:hypothetical protein